MRQDPSQPGGSGSDVVNKTRELVVSHFASVALVVLVVLASFVSTFNPAQDVVDTIRGDKDISVASVASATATYVLLTAIFGAVLLVLTSLRFSQSRRRICAPWGVVTSIVGLGFLLFIVFLGSVIFFDNTPATELTPRILLAVQARQVLPFVTFLTFIVALSWGLFGRWKPAKAMKRALQLATASVLTAVPIVTAAMWFVWQA